MLSNYRVLDLADDRGIFCGRILGDLGADVIKVEQPTGDPARYLGPFLNDEPMIENSLFWQAYSANKRGITLDIENPDAREILLKLVKTAHFFVESYRPGYLSAIGLGYKDIQEINPGIIYISITPFGQNGPYANYEATDLTGMALSGFMYLTGDADRPPVRVSGPQFWLLGGAAGAAGAMLAHHHWRSSQRGQHVDVSCQQAMARTLSHAPQFWDLNEVILKRSGPFRPMGSGMGLRTNWECKDGYVNYIQPGGLAGGRSMASLCAWMEEEGYGDSYLSNTDFGQYGFGEMPEDLLQAMDKGLGLFFKANTKAHLSAGALERRVLLFPVNDPSDVLSYPQLLARGFFQEAEGPDEHKFTTLGPWVRLSEEQMRLRRRAPRLGEHNQEIYESLGLNPNEIQNMRAEGAI